MTNRLINSILIQFVRMKMLVTLIDKLNQQRHSIFLSDFDK